MTTLPNRWMLLASLAIAAALWLSLSSVAANAAHVFAKGNFSWRGYGSISVWPVAAGLLWVATVYYVATTRGALGTKGLLLGWGTVFAWVALLLFLTVIADPWLGQIKAASLLVWMVELAGVVVILSVVQRYWPPIAGVQGWLPVSVLALTLATGAKALLFCLLPGMTVRL